MSANGRRDLIRRLKFNEVKQAKVPTAEPQVVRSIAFEDEMATVKLKDTNHHVVITSLRN